MRRLILTAALAVLAAPALAQEASASPAPASDTVPVVVPAKSAEELAIEAQAVAFRTAMVAMQDELVKTTTSEEADAIVTRYQPQAEALADRIDAFLIAHANQPENEANRQQLMMEATNAVARVRTLPTVVRLAVDRAVANGKVRAAPATGSGADAETTTDQAPSQPSEPGQTEPAPTDPAA